MRLQGKNVIITGARTGIGRACVELFAREGANIWAVVHREDTEWLSAMQTLAQQTGRWIRPVYIDLSDEEQIKIGMQSIIREKQPIDILVNAAGVVSEKRLFAMTSLSDMRKLMDVNFFAVIQLCQLTARIMMRQKRGCIINISSVSAWADDSAQLEYAASKAAINCATKKMAAELGAYNIRVNSIAPGLIDTKMLAQADEQAVAQLRENVSLKRIGTPKNIASMAVVLASDESEYLTGQVIRVDGGM